MAISSQTVDMFCKKFCIRGLSKLQEGMGNVVDKIVADRQEGAPKNVLEMYQKLINMGYSKQMAMLAAKKHPKHIVKAIDWIDQNEIKTDRNEMNELQKQIEELKLNQKKQGSIYNVYNQTVYNNDQRQKSKSKYDSVIHENGNNEILRAKHKIYGKDGKGRTLYQGPKGGIYRLSASGSKVYVRRE